MKILYILNNSHETFDRKKNKIGTKQCDIGRELRQR